MRVLQTLRITGCLLTLAVFAKPSHVFSQTSSCADISKDVASAIEKDSSKTLMIVEDALVINEACACEIIKAAILASHADAALVNQIVQTGISVAPKMSGVITDCATAVAPSAGVQSPASYTTEVVESGKDTVKNPLPVIPTEEDFSSAPSSVRGVYLIQPGASGLISRSGNRKDCNVPTSQCYCTPEYQ